MIRALLIVVLCCQILYSEPIRLTDSSKQIKEINSNFTGLFFDKQNRRHRIVLSSPTVSSIGEGEVVFSYTGGVYSMWIKIGGILKYISLK
jgi:hypothetical protein